MKDNILLKIWIYTMIYLHLTAAATDNSTTSPGRSKRSFGFGFSNPIFSRVFNPYDDRPLAAKFFGNDYAPPPRYAHNFGHSRYHSNRWNHNSRSHPNYDSRYGYREEKTHFHGYRGWKKPTVKYGIRPYPPHIDVLKKPKVEETTTKKQPVNITPKGEYIFKSLPLYDIVKPFRTPEEVKKFHAVKSSPNIFKPKNVSEKKPTMEYIFNLLPHYEIREVFKPFTPSTTTVRVLKSTEGYEKIASTKEHGVLTAIEQTVQLPDAKDHNKPKQNEMKTIQIPKNTPNAPNLYHFKDLPLYDINVKFREKQEESFQFVKVSENHKPSYLTLLPNLEIKTVFNEKKTTKISPTEGKHVKEKAEASQPTFVLPNYSIRETFNDKTNDTKPFTSKPSILLIESDKKSITLPQNLQSSFVLPKVESSVKFSEHKKDNIFESKLKSSITQSTSTSRVKEIIKPTDEKTKHVGISEAGQKSSRYKPHRTKIIESYSPFLSLPAVVVYQRFNEEQTLSNEKKSPNNVPSVKEAIFVPEITELSAKFPQTIVEPPNANDVPQRLPSVIPNYHFSTTRPSSNPSTQSTNGQRPHIQKIEPLTERPTLRFSSQQNQAVPDSQTDPTIHFLEAPVHEFQSFNIRNAIKVPENQKNEYQLANTEIGNQHLAGLLELPQLDPSYFRSFKRTSSSSSQSNRGTTSIPPNKSSVVNKSHFNPNIPQSILDTLGEQKSDAPETPRVKYITQSVVIKPIEGNLLTLPLPSFNKEESGELKSFHTIKKSSRNDVRKSHEEMEEQNAPSLMNNLDTKVLKAHHVRRKPPTSIEYSLMESNRLKDSTKIRTRTQIPQNHHLSPQKLYKKEKITNVTHKRVRVDTKRLPSEKQIDFRALPYYDNKGTSFKTKMVYKIVGDEDNMKVQEDEIKQSFVNNDIDAGNDTGKISIGDIPLEKHKIWDTNKNVFINSYGEAME